MTMTTSLAASTMMLPEPRTDVVMGNVSLCVILSRPTVAAGDGVCAGVSRVPTDRRPLRP